MGDDGKTFVFTLDVLPSGRMQVTVADPDGNSPGWPGMPDTLLEGNSQPILLPIPPSWSAAIEIETDGAPEDMTELLERIPPVNPDDPLDPSYRSSTQQLDRFLLGDLHSRIFGDCECLIVSYDYDKIGRNRATLALTWRRAGSEDDEETPFDRNLLESTFFFDLSFLTEDSGTVKLTITREGESPVTLDGFLDLKAGSSGTDSFPDELELPNEAPQASGQDRNGVQIAPVTTPDSIGQNDIQTFLVHNVGSQPASYSPGDWLEPKDGGNQRMMVVASSQPAAAGPTAQAHPSKSREPAMPTGFPNLADWVPYESPGALPPRQQSMNSELTQISVVCMQLEQDLPSRGARYFSQPKSPEGEVQLCQENCVTAGGEAIQGCVWDCETNPSRGAFQLVFENASPRGVTFANNRFFVVDAAATRVFAYSASGEHEPAADFDLVAGAGSPPEGLTFANNRFFVVDGFDGKVYAYSASGQRDPAADFDLVADNDRPNGVTFANNRFFVVDWFDNKAYAYSASGQHEPAADFDFVDFIDARGITFANDRFFVVDATGQEVLAYSASGQRDPAADFDLVADNYSAAGITFANDTFFVVYRFDATVYAYSAPWAPTGTVDGN